MEVVHFRFVRIELDPNMGTPSGEVGEELFQLGVIFDNDGNIININDNVRVLGDQTLDQQLVDNNEQKQRARAPFFHAPCALEIYLFPLYVCVCVCMCIHLAEGGHIIWREPCMVRDGEDDLMDCGRDIQQNYEGLPSLHFVLMERVD